MVHSNPSNQVTDAVSLATIGMVNRLGAKAILSLTETGFTPRMISRHRPECPIIAVTTSAVVARKLALNWGVLPLLHTGKENDDAKIRCGIERARELDYLRSGDLVLIITGTPQTAGGTNSIRVMTID